MVIPENVNYTAVEAPKGEFGVFIVSSGLNKPNRCRMRAPGIFSFSWIKQNGKRTKFSRFSNHNRDSRY